MHLLNRDQRIIQLLHDWNSSKTCQTIYYTIIQVYKRTWFGIDFFGVNSVALKLKKNSWVKQFAKKTDNF